jgi:hypothetical protein
MSFNVRMSGLRVERNRSMNGLFAFLLVLPIGAGSAAGQNNPDKKEWVQLFNGHDLKDWDIKISGHELNDNFGDTFRVQDGLLKVAYDKYTQFDSQFGHIFYRRKFSYYIIAVEYRFLGNQTPGGPDWGFRNSGIMIHSQSAQSMLKNQDFPISIEVQLLGGGGTGTRPTANLCTPGTHVEYKGQLYTEHCLQSSAKTYHGDQWVRVEAVVHGDEKIRHVVEGETVLEYSKPQIGGEAVTNFDPAVKQDGRPLTEGYISLQAESHPLEFRKVELLDLVGCMNPKARNFKSYFIKADNSKCRYADSKSK